MSELISLQGKVYSALRDPNTVRPGNFTWFGNVPEAPIAPEVDKEDRNESFSGSRLLYATLQKARSAKFSLKLDKFLPENLALGLYGTPVDVDTGPWSMRYSQAG